MAGPTIMLIFEDNPAAMKFSDAIYATIQCVGEPFGSEELPKLPWHASHPIPTLELHHQQGVPWPTRW